MSIQRLLFEFSEPFTFGDVVELVQQKRPELILESGVEAVKTRIRCILQNWVLDGTLWLSGAEFTFRYKPIFPQ